MAQMGQGISEAGARIGQMLQSGYESMGKGLAGGINAASSAYGDYKKMQSEIKASEKAYDTFKGFLSPEARKSIDEKIGGINSDTNLSLQDKAAFWNQAKSFIGGSVNQGFAMQKQQAELDAAAARQREQIAAQEMMPFRQQAAGMMFSAPAPSAGFTPQPFSIQSTQPTNMFGIHQ